MTDVAIKEESVIDSDGVKALQLKEEIIVFYKLGFLDAYLMCNNLRIPGNTKRGYSREARLFQRISGRCKERFEKRFMKNLDKQVKKVRSK